MILIEYDYLPSSSDRHVRASSPREGALRLRVRRVANRARGNFLSDEWMDGRKRELEPANGLPDLIYEEQSSAEFQVRDRDR